MAYGMPSRCEVVAYPRRRPTNAETPRRPSRASAAFGFSGVCSEDGLAIVDPACIDGLREELGRVHGRPSSGRCDRHVRGAEVAALKANPACVVGRRGVLVGAEVREEAAALSAALGNGASKGESGRKLDQRLHPGWHVHLRLARNGIAQSRDLFDLLHLARQHLYERPGLRQCL
jgi:hypothetical protein